MLSDNDQSWQFRGRADPWHERILRPPTFVNSNYATTTVGGQARHSKSRKTFRAKSGPVAKSPLPDKDCHSAFVVPHDRSCAVQLIRLFHASFTFSRPGLLRSQLMIGEHLSLLIAMAGANLGCYLWGKLFLDIILFSSALTQMNPNFWAPNIDESLNIANRSQTRFFQKRGSHLIIIQPPVNGYILK